MNPGLWTLMHTHFFSKTCSIMANEAIGSVDEHFKFYAILGEHGGITL